MNKAFNKALLFCVSKYSLFNTLLDVLKELANEAYGFDIRNKIPPSYFRINTQMFRLPSSVRNKWDNFFLEKVNNVLLEDFYREEPDLVMVYNSEFLLPETCEKIAKKAKLVKQYLAADKKKGLL